MDRALKWRDAAYPGVTLGAFVMVLLLVLRPSATHAQQLEPRAYSPSPVGVNFIGLGTLYSSGGIVTDPSLPIENIDAEVPSIVPFYGRTFGLFGRLANVTFTTPYAWATVQGDVSDVSRSVDRSGLLDPQLRFAVNLIGGPALTPQEFRSHEPQTTLGASLTVVAPFGQYDSAKLINLGTNRWAFKPELGLSQPFGKWTFEVYASVWLFQTNDDFFGGQEREQHPLESYQAHVVYAFRPNLWASADYTYYAGGSTTVNGQPNNDRQGNTRAGLTLAVPMPRNQSMKFNWTQGVSTRIGSSFETIGVAWQWLWL
jgi:Putative MetA-pathway of phenol degradation